MINQVIAELTPLRKKLLNHPLYQKINTIQDVRTFTEHHVFAVWDFMSLLKGLQIQLTTVTIPWTPSKQPATRRFINEIVLGEESDIDKSGQPMSHYEMYLEAMDQINANTKRIKTFVNKIEEGRSVKSALENVQAEKTIREFVEFTFEVLATEKPHIIAAVFTFGREDLIPDLFIEIVKGLEKNTTASFDKIIYYLERHIELDGDEHGPISLKMVEELCGTDKNKWEEAIYYSKIALEKRILLWDGIRVKL